MSTQTETLSTFQPWRVGNHFSLTLRGHWSKLPQLTSDIVVENQYNPYETSAQYSSKIRSIVGTTNYETLYDSFYAPVDFKIRGLTIRMPMPLPQGTQLDLKLKVNGGVIETFEMPEFVDHNTKRYDIDCDFLIYEDDFIEIEITATNYDDLSFNDNNVSVSISGCVSYVMYKEITSDITVRLATTKNITLKKSQKIDGVTAEDNDFVLVKNQNDDSENGIYRVSGGGNWARHPSYPDLHSIEGLIIYVSDGLTQNSTATTNYTAIDDGEGSWFIGYPLINWNEGDNWYKTNILLQNRSGNDTINDRIFLDMIKSPMHFLFQGISFSLFEDDLRVVDKFRERVVCIYLDILVNGRSILPYTNFPRPISIDSDTIHRNYELSSFNSSQGFPIRFGDSIDIRAYLDNHSTKYNGKLVNVFLYGCSPDCATWDSPTVAVYEPCEEEPCVWKHTVVQRCEPEDQYRRDADGNLIGPSPYNPNISPVPALPSGASPENGLYVTLDGQAIQI